METIDTSGFYKFDGDKWYYAPNAVYNLNYELLRNDKDTYSYPIDGWNWFNEEPLEYREYLDSLENEQ